MAKDPAFPFYSQDFLTGTMFFTDEQVGVYVRLLIAQHQLGGIIKKSDFVQRIGHHEIIKEKFIETEDGFYNERLMKEMVKREKKSTNLSDNAKKRWMQKESKSYAIASNLHMPIEYENERVIVDKGIFEIIKKNIEETPSYWLGLFKITKVPENIARKHFPLFWEEQANCENYMSGPDLKKYYQNWLKKNRQQIMNENGQTTQKLSYSLGLR